MTPERWRQVEELFHAARDPARRANVLAAADPELRREVEELLRRDAGDPSSPSATGRAAGTIDDSTLTMIGAGAQLGPYKIEAPIGKGGMGEVFRAVDTRLGRKVAIKISNKQFDSRFAREAQAISALNHPHICTLYDVGPNYLVMELVEGESLAARLKKGKLSIPDTLRYGAQIADALSEAHAKGITHRDLKPGNVMLAKNGVKVLDFGLAKLQTDATMTASNVVMGTPAYMAPEQLEGREADARTDIYALGLVLYEMATGKRPVKQQGAGAAPDSLPQPLAHIVGRCLEENPEARWKSAGEIRALLEWPAVGPQPGSATAARRWLWPAVVAAAAAIVVAAIAVLPLFRPAAAPAGRQMVRFTVPLPAGGNPDLSDFALSPDGRNLAITSGQSGHRNLYVRSVDSLSAKLIPNTDGAAYPFWSPDGSQIAFESEGRLRKVAASGGEVFTLVEKIEGAYHGGTWNQRGTILFAAKDRIHMVADSGGTPVELTNIGGGLVLSHPDFLHGGSTFLYTAEGGANGEGQGIYVGSLDNSEAPVKLVTDRSKGVYVPSSGDTGYLLFRRKGILVAQPFDPGKRAVSGAAIPLTSEPVISRTGYGPTVLFASAGNALAYQTQTLERLIWVDRAGQLVETAAAPGEYTNFRLSPDGSRITMNVYRYDTEPSFVDIARLDLRRGTLERLTFHGDADLVPLFSPDGRRIVFTSRRLGAFDPFITDGPNQEKLVVDIKPTGGWPVDWSPDGRLLLWEAGTGGLWVIPLQDGGEPYEFVPAKFKARGGQFSPDGNWMAYSSSESGREEVYVQAFPRGPRFTVTAGGGKEPAWRRDGHELFYVAGDGMLTAVPVTVKSTSVEFGPTQRLFPAPLGQFRRNYEVSPDGKRFLIATPANPGGDAITVVLNWQANLKP